MPREDLIQLRGGTEVAWAAANPVLNDREPGVAVDIGVMKIGDGATPWNDLEPMTGSDVATSSPADVDNVTAAALVRMPDTTVNGFVVKMAGDDTLYGRGQAFMVLKEGAGDATDETEAGSVLFRIDASGSVGMTGGLHVASGFREPFVGSQAVWIDPSENIVGLVVTNPSVAESATWDKDFIQVTDVRAEPDANVFRVAFNGEVKSTQSITAHDGKTAMTLIGDVFGFPGIGFGTGVDTVVYRADTSVVGLGNRARTGGAGTTALPAYSFVGDPNTGMWNGGADILSFATGGSTVLSLTTVAMILADTVNFAVGTGTGTKFGTATDQKIGFHNAAPTVQRAGVAQTALATTGATQTTPFGYTTAAQANAIVSLVNEIRATLVEKGLMKGAA